VKTLNKVKQIILIKKELEMLAKNLTQFDNPFLIFVTINR